MLNLDSVEKLREVANVSYEDARAALESCGGDLLDAIILLEKQGKVAPPKNGGSYSSEQAPGPQPAYGGHAEKSTPKGESFMEAMNRFFDWCGKVIHSGFVHQFEVWHKNSRILSVPVTLLIILLLFAFWIVVPLLVVGLFFSCRYSVSGSGAKAVNSAMDSAANAAEGIKSEILNSTKDSDSENK
jgi:hypothetical protein